ncbi:SMI1/KNR4 family protein [Photorhabdus laumondii]|uniref:SMI1/KNR4 family protein n=1 Tax=Photorhabdus laumondii TaxID=2218628 RepID=UPI0025AF8CEE|nr:SMI1/KNR4 family protein [Photorhabdus laumondii]
MLLTIKEISEQLDEKFSLLGDDFDDLKLSKRYKPLLNVEILEKKLNVIFPKEFLSFIKDYDLDNLSLGNISFGNGSDYLEMIVNINSESAFNHWWIGENRPKEFIVIAISDPYTILLNTITGEVFVMTSESSMDDFEQVSTSFELFIRGVGTIFLGKETSTKIIKYVGSRTNEFWEEIAN